MSQLTIRYDWNGYEWQAESPDIPGYAESSASFIELRRTVARALEDEYSEWVGMIPILGPVRIPADSVTTL